MGHRADYVIVESGRASIHHSRFGALSIAVDALLGPQELADYAGELEARDKLTDDTWCEGALLADYDVRLLLLHTDHGPVRESIGFRRAYLAVLRERWPGWQVRWAARDQADIVDHLGMDPENVIKDRSPPWPAMTVADVVAGLGMAYTVFNKPVTTEDYRRSVDLTESPPDFGGPHAETVLTVRFADGALRDFSCGWDIPVGAALDTGPDLLAALADQAGHPLPNELCAGEGVFIDARIRQIQAWPTPRRRSLERSAQRWPGWTVGWHDEGLPEQAAQSGRSPAPYRLTADHLLRLGARLLGASQEQIWNRLEEHTAALLPQGGQILHQSRRPPTQPDLSDERTRAVLARLLAHA
jgi:hypothetical protein